MLKALSNKYLIIGVSLIMELFSEKVHNPDTRRRHLNRYSTIVKTRAALKNDQMINTGEYYSAKSH